jgi:hypothetical protein
VAAASGEMAGSNIIEKIGMVKSEENENMAKIWHPSNIWRS